MSLSPQNSGLPAERPHNTSPEARTARSATPHTVSRAAETANTPVVETRTGAAYEQCKNAYFTCMDQFCRMKNDDYRRCSCSDRVYELADGMAVLQSADDQLTVFTEGLDAVGMTAAQAAAMRTASEGENALTSDSSASKALLQAIMNSIRGGDTSVGGKFSSLNSINLTFDTTNAFGMSDTGQVIATYNGQNLYTAVYPQCRDVVRTDCTDAALQRAVTAYLMAVESDCNTVQSAIGDAKKKMTAAVREGGAMLDLARVENRRNHNSDDMTACMDNVESAVLSEEVCGANYHKCLDNGQFIDVSTGAPIAGVVQFYELEQLLKWGEGINIADQQLSRIPSNRGFVQNFENRVKKFAEPALDKCVEVADIVWADYLDKAMLAIYYAQKDKVAEIKQGCFDFVSSCYVNGDNALTAAMTELVGDSAILLQPDKIAVNSAVCREYVQSCDNMFDGNIVQQYVDEREQTDTLAACRAVVKQCFDKFGGTGYVNFYYPFSGLFQPGRAPNWFVLYDHTSNGSSYLSECAKQLSQIASCSSRNMMEKAFGGLDLMNVTYKNNKFTVDSDGEPEYGITRTGDDTFFLYRGLRPSGVATEIYYQIIDTLKSQCETVSGRFMELQFLLEPGAYAKDDICITNFGVGNNNTSGTYALLTSRYGIRADGEDICPRDYRKTVDIKSWGACNCWENGARRSKDGQSAKCVAELPFGTTNGEICTPSMSLSETNWCIQGSLTNTQQVCPITANSGCSNIDDIKKYIPKSIY